MSIEVTMPKLALTMREGKLVEWLKKEGDQVSEGELLFIVEGEKVTTEVEAPTSGVLGKVLVPAGETVSCDTVLAVIVSIEEWEEGKAITIEPAARAAEEAIAKEPKVEALEGVRVVHLEGRKKVIADNMLHAWQTMVIFSQTMDADASALLSLRAELLPRIEKEAGIRLTLTDLLVKIVAWGLREMPELNAYLEGDELQIIDRINIGISAATPEGLILPVVHDADKKSLVEISKTVRDITERASQGKLTLDDISGGTFTLNNVGPIGVENGFAIISPPQVAILTFCKTVKKPVVRDDKIVIAPIMTLLINVNHRAIDGAISAEFLRMIKSAVEDPSIIGPWD